MEFLIIFYLILGIFVSIVWSWNEDHIFLERLQYTIILTIFWIFLPIYFSIFEI